MGRQDDDGLHQTGMPRAKSRDSSIGHPVSVVSLIAFGMATAASCALIIGSHFSEQADKEHKQQMAAVGAGYRTAADAIMNTLPREKIGDAVVLQVPALITGQYQKADKQGETLCTTLKLGDKVAPYEFTICRSDTTGARVAINKLALSTATP